MENGDRLSREEFERRYDSMPHIKKAELIDGIVFMPSPVRFNRHAEQHSWLNWWLTTFAGFTPGVRVGDNATTRLDPNNEPQPDNLLFIDTPLGGQAQIDADGYVAGAPELIGEIAASSVSIDLGAKFSAYRKSGVREYIVWRVFDHALDWFILHQQDFVPLLPGADGILRSEQFPGLWLDSAALVSFNLPRHLEVVQRGLQSPEHQEFVAKLRSSATPQV